MLKGGHAKLLPCLVKLFNLCFSNGYPDTWVNHRRLSQKYARYVPKIPQALTHSYYPHHFNRYFPCQNVDRMQIAY